MIGIQTPTESGKLARFQTLIQDDLREFRQQYRQTLQSGHKLIDQVVAFLVRSHGKGLRPTLTLLCGKLGGASSNENAIRSAVIAELLHEATLVHDDVVDEAPKRRGIQSLASRFKNKVSVLFGDYMLANVLSETIAVKDFRWLEILSEASRRMARGQLLEMVHSRRLDLTEAEYLRMIGDKTSALFSACCKMGGYSAGLPLNMVESLGEYGEKLGLAFQIRDDLLDLFGYGWRIGKPVGGDIKDRKLTLPLIGALEKAPARQVRRIKARIRRGVRRRDMNTIKEFISDYQGEKHAEKAMVYQSEHAIAALQELPDSPVLELMKKLARYAIERTR